MAGQPKISVSWLMLAAGLAFAAVVGIQQWRVQERLKATALDFHVAQRTKAVEQGLQRTLRMIDVNAAFLAAGPTDEQAYRAFAEPLVDRDPDLHALGLDVVVSREQRADHEAERQREHPDYQITESRDGSLVRADDRDMYVVVQYIAPIEGNRQALGFDIASEKTRAAAIERARRTSETTLTGPITLVQHQEQQIGLLAMRPIRDDALAAGAFVIPEMLTTSLGNLQPAAVDLWLTDVTGDPQPLYRWSGQERRVGPHEPAPTTAKRSSQIHIGGRTWRLDFVDTETAGIRSLLPYFGVPLAIVTLSVLLFVLLRGRERERSLIQRAADRLELALDAVTTGAWDWNLTTDDITLSDNWLAGMGHTLTGDGFNLDFWRSTLHPDDESSWTAALQQHLSGDSAVFLVRARRLTADGDYRWYEDRGRVVERAGNGKPTRMVGTGTDVSDQVEQEQRASEEQETRQRAHRMQSLGLLAGGVAHDFNNLLTPILANLDEVELAVPENSEAREVLQHIRQAAQHAAALTHQMLDYVGRSTVQMRILDPGDAARQMERLLQTSVPSNLDFEVEIDAGLPPVLADVSQLKQVVLNLVINAVEVQPDHGMVRLRIFSGVPVHPAVIGTMPAPEGVCIEVRDAGPGLPSDAESIFDPFNTSKKRGRGLGLSVVQGAVLAHGGAIAVQSGQQGSTFQVWLPIADDQPAKPDAIVPRIEATENHKLQVLVVDDDPLVRRVTCRILASAGHDVREARDGIEALAVADGTQFDVVLLDLEMPRMGGIAALPQMLERQATARLVICSGYSQERIDQDLLRNPRIGWLSKPYQAKQLLAALYPEARITPW